MPLDWMNDRKKQLMRRRGTENIKEDDPSMMAPLSRARRPKPLRRPKSDLRAEGEAAYAAWQARGGK